MAILQEFDLEIQPMKLVRGHGFKKMISNNDIGNKNKFGFDDEVNT